MKRIKKLIVALVVAGLLLSTVGMGFAAVPADVEGKDCEAAVTNLVALGIVNGYPDGTYKPEGLVTRAEFAKIAVISLGLEDAANAAKVDTKFPDVKADHWAAGYINVAVDQGLLKGYPDGTFKPSNNVTYAEALAIMVRALGYEPAVKGVWPTNYISKAADLEITKDVSFTANAPANRGDVALVVDNSLDVQMMIQEGFGDQATFKVSDNTKDTLLGKMGVTKIEEGRVTANFKVDSDLDKNEIQIDNDKVYEVADNIDVDAILGVKVTAWEKDDKLFKVTVETAAKDILVDAVDTTSSDTTSAQAFLINADKAYEYATGYKAYVNNAEDDAGIDGLSNDLVFGRFVLEKGKIAFAYLYALDNANMGVVTEVNGDAITYRAVSDSEEEIDLDDADAVYVFDGNLAKADVEDIKVDTAIYFYDNGDDEYFIVAVNNKVEGKLDRIRDTEIRVDGKLYDKAENAIATLDEGDTYVAWNGIDSIADLSGENVKVVLDFLGDAMFVAGDAKVTSSELYGVAVYYNEGRNDSVDIFTKDGEANYVLEDDADGTTLSGITYSAITFAAVEFKLNSDGEIADDTLTVQQVGDAVQLAKSADKDYVIVSGSGIRYYFDKDTVLIKAVNDNKLDPKVLDYDSFYKSAFTASSETAAIVFGTEGQDAKAIIFVDNAFQGSDDDYYYGVVTKAVAKDGDDYVTTVYVAGLGEKEYVVDNKDDWAKGTAVAFYLNSDGKAVVDDSNAALTPSAIVVTPGAVTTPAGMITTAPDKPYITVTGTAIATDGAFKVADDAVIYTVKADNTLDSRVSFSKLDADDAVLFVVDEDDARLIKAMLVRKP